MIVKEQDTELQPAPNAPRIKDMHSDDTPRERAEKLGCASLTIPELWAIILRTGVSGNPIMHLCRSLMEANDNRLTLLERRTRRELLAIKGLGKLKVIQIEAVMELIRRYNREEASGNPIIKGSQAIFKVMRPHLGHLDHEEVWALFLNQRNEVLKLYQVSKGGLASTIFDIKMIIKEALLENAACVVLCHNHPSGNLRPSPQDDQITRRCKEACAIMELRMLDHIIVSADSTHYYSYFDEGRL